MSMKPAGDDWSGKRVLFYMQHVSPIGLKIVLNIRRACLSGGVAKLGTRVSFEPNRPREV